jgi:hypothetical protein
MSKTVVLLTSVLAVFLFVGFVAAEDAATVVKGKVAVTKAEGKVTAIAIVVSEKEKVAVKLDEKGLALAAMDGKAVEAKGKVTEAAGAKTLEVAACKLAEEKPAPKVEK